jgi:alanine dehydrogenase
MKVGVIKEIKDKEQRVALTPAGAKALHKAGHTVLVQAGAGLGSGFSDTHYCEVGAHIVPVEQAWDTDLVLKVKEPLAVEYPYLQEQILFTYFHLAGAPPTLTDTLLKQKTTAVAYETVEDAQGRLPLLAPMSAIAGNMAITVGSYYLAKFNHGKGVQLGTVLGARYGKVVIIGDGVVGQHAAKTADGMGAQVFLGGIDDSKCRNSNTSFRRPWSALSPLPTPCPTTLKMPTSLSAQSCCMPLKRHTWSPRRWCSACNPAQ